MSNQKHMFMLTLLCIMLLLASCSVKDKANSNKQTDRKNQESPYKAIDKGILIRKDENSWLITKYMDNNEQSYIAAIEFVYNETTIVQDQAAQVISLDDISIGSEVEVWSVGLMQESYPARAFAAKLIVASESVKPTNDQIGQSAAIEAALQTLTQSSHAKAVRSIVLDKDLEQWIVELVYHEALEERIIVHVNARTGQIIAAPAVENHAFRLHSPVPGTEVQESFIVEGEARVFEGAFSWKLEDGHHIVAEGNETAVLGGPEWGHFKFEVSYEQTTQPNLTLTLFEYSAEDGSIQNQLHVPLKGLEG